MLPFCAFHLCLPLFLPRVNPPVDLLQPADGAIKPGGWIELQELRLKVYSDDDSMPQDYGLALFLDNLREGFSKFGVNLLSLDKNQELLREAGFTNIEEKVWKGAGGRLGQRSQDEDGWAVQPLRIARRLRRRLPGAVCPGAQVDPRGARSVSSGCEEVIGQHIRTFILYLSILSTSEAAQCRMINEIIFIAPCLCLLACLNWSLFLAGGTAPAAGICVD